MRFQTTRRNVVKGGGIVLAGTAVVGSASARRNFNAHLSGAAHDLETNAQGQANFQLRGDGLAFELIVANIEDVLMAHIHLDRVLGPVSVWLHDFESESPELVEGRVNGVLSAGTITDAKVGHAAAGRVDTVDQLVAEIDAGNAWVNVHTQEFGSGEIGGQIQARN